MTEHDDRHRPVHRLVLDAHGVVLNAPLQAFLRVLAEETGQHPEDVLRRWKTDLRIPAWTGGMEDAELWTALVGGRAPDRSASEWQARLEATYEPGPAAAHLAAWSEEVPIWMLANHRSHWLLPRLERFGLLRYFDQVFVSDALGAAKPTRAAFEPLLGTAIDTQNTLYVDDQLHNVERARELGLQAIQLTDGTDALSKIGERLRGTHSAAPSTSGEPSPD